MVSAYTADRFGVRIESEDFPCDRLRIRKLSGREAISRLFAFDLLVVGLDRAEIPLDAVAGAEVTLVFERDGHDVRHVHGMVTEVDDMFAGRSEMRSYRMRIAPRAHRLTMIETQDLFVDTSVPEVLQQKVALVGLEDTELRLLAAYPRRELIVQYAESDFAFLCHLAEHVGVSFFFEQKDGRDVLVFTDHADGFQPVPGAERAAFDGHGDARDVFALEQKRRIVPSYYAVRDYDYQNPLLDLTSDAELATGYPGGVIEQGTNYKTLQEGSHFVRVRAEERRSTQHVYSGKSDLPAFTAGARVRLEGHPELDTLDLLLVEVTHEASLVVAGSGDEGVSTYVNTFRATPAAHAYRPPRITPRPRIAGLLTGVIDAAQTGGQAYAPIDEQGRYRVRFLFDTTARQGRPASCPVRMIQNHVGENYGTHHPLRPDAEVLVGFVNGDPDRPVIVGAVPNPLKPSPVTNRNPAAHRMQTISGITIEIVDET
jgi:type VI secretion system secreted protein VgrG